MAEPSYEEVKCFPVTLYYEQWIRLLEAGEKLRTFLGKNKAAGKLKLKEK